MAIIKDVTVKINNGTATLDAPIQFYEKDHDVELRFKLMDYKYKYDKDPQNILNSVDEDILEAYTTIVNPRGYELEQINGVVKNDTVIFRLDPTYTDELDELGTYKLQIHIKCTCSEFTIPPISFEVLQRLKGIKVVTDGEDEVDNSEILDNSSKFVSDETGKLIIEWKKGDMISSAKLNAMVDVINDAVDEEVIRQANEKERERKVDASISDYATRFNALTVSRQQDAEVIDARDGEQTLRARLDRDVQKPLIIYEEVEGSSITVDSKDVYLKDVEILGNTFQNADDLADIRSVGGKVEGQELYEIPVLNCGKNLFNKNTVDFGKSLETATGQPISNASYNISDFIPVKPNTHYIRSKHTYMYYYDSKYKFIEYLQQNTPSPSNAKYCRLQFLAEDDLNIFQLEEGTVATPYEPYQEDKITILSPVQLEKVGDVADRIVCKDGVWGVEKKIDTVIFNETYNWITGNTMAIPWAEVYMDIKTIYKTDITTPERCLTNLPVTDVYSGNSRVGISYIYDIKNFRIRLKDTGTTADEIKEYLRSNPIVFKYKLDEYQFIPLPHDQQIKLRTFANKTNISFLTEIEPTLKASMPKSLGATVDTHTEQIGNLSKELDRVKKLEESTVSIVVTESDVTDVENTSNGYFEDVKLEGRTLVNIAHKKARIGEALYDFSFDGEYYSVDKDDKSIGIRFDNKGNDFVVGETITFIIDNVSDIGLTVSSSDYAYIRTLSKGLNIFKLTIADNTKKVIVGNIDNVKKEQGLLKFSVLILEGDHTQNPPEFFEGIKSVGQDVNDIIIATTNAPMLFGKGGKK